ncbi:MULTISPECIES: efflux RND transporter permease subunit [Roseobacteraceae]|uniref:efflux RND transporter permease subunit n=1 Tax=Roseobacteraceae TaxID=2854170 RepID=UPI002B270D62|nr:MULTISPECIES: MMPL family transporter [Roseobacteraceae]
MLAWIVLLAIDGLAFQGLKRLEFGHGLDRVFQSDADRYSDYAALAEDFGDTDELLIRVATQDLASPGARVAVEQFLIELQLAEPAWTVLSPFSFAVPDTQGGTVTLASVEGPADVAWARALTAQPLLARFVRADRKAALITVLGVRGAGEIDAIRHLAEQYLTASELSFGLSGLQVILERSRVLLMQDFLFLNVTGAVLGTIVAVFAMNSVWLALITLLSAGTAVLWAMGALGWMGIEINVISIALPVLVLALAFSDAVHIGLEQRTLTLSRVRSPVWSALRRIGPAAVLTSLTTAIAFVSLSVSGSPLLADVGKGGALAVIAAALGVLAAHGLVGTTLLRFVAPERVYPPQRTVTPRLFNWQFLPIAGLSAPRAVSTIAICTAVLASGLYFMAAPRFSLNENLRQSDSVLTTLKQIEADFGATAVIQIPVHVGRDSPVVTARATLAALPKPQAENAVSVAAFADAAAASGMSIDQAIGVLSPQMREVLTGARSGRMLVSIPFDYGGAEETRALVSAIEGQLVETLPPDLRDRVGRATGPHVMSAFVSETMIRSLSLSLLLAIATSGLIIAVWLRSVRLGLVALVPNVLPVAIAGAALGLSGHGVTFAAGISLTLAFGISVDDTIHVLNRLRLASREPQSPGDSIETAMQHVTPALVVTTIVLSAGLCGTLAATLPTVAQFGMLAIFALFLALVSDLLVLPAMLRRFAP